MAYNPDMNACGKSDAAVVPVKGRTKRVTAAEAPEGRAETKGNPQELAMTQTQCCGQMSVGLQRIREAAKRDKNLRFTALLHHITPQLLRISYFSGLLWAGG